MHWYSFKSFPVGTRCKLQSTSELCQVSRARCCVILCLILIFLNMAFRHADAVALALSSISARRKKKKAFCTVCACLLHYSKHMLIGHSFFTLKHIVSTTHVRRKQNFFFMTTIPGRGVSNKTCHEGSNGTSGR